MHHFLLDFLVMAGLALPLASCGLVLGLDEFTDAPVSTGSTSTSTGGGGQGGSGGTAGSGGQAGGGGVGGGDVVWAQIYGDANAQHITGIALDPDGNAIVTGTFQGTLNLGGSALISAGGDDIFLAKFDKDGSPIWSKQFGSAADQKAHSVAVDANGNIIIAGSFRGSLTFGGITFQGAADGSLDAFVAKFDPTGGHLWSKPFGSVGAQACEDVAIAGSTGNVLLIGWFDSSIDFGNGALTSTGGTDRDVFIAQLTSATGDAVWSRDYGDPGFQTGRNIAVDPAGNIAAAGFFFDGMITFGSDVLTNNDPGDAFVARLDANGNSSWASQIGGLGVQDAKAISTSGLGELLVSGASQNAADFGCGAVISIDDYDAFLAKLDSAGNCVWSHRYGNAGADNATSLGLDENGNVVAVGYFSTTIQFGNDVLATQGGQDIFVTKVNGEGLPLWSKPFGGLGKDVAVKVATSSAFGGVLLALETDGSLELGPQTLSSKGSTDIVLVKLAP